MDTLFNPFDANKNALSAELPTGLCNSIKQRVCHSETFCPEGVVLGRVNADDVSSGSGRNDVTAACRTLFTL